MRTAGGSTRQRAAYSAIAAGVALLIALAEIGATASAAGVPAAADTATAAALYEPVAADSAGASATGKSALSTLPASTGEPSASAADASTEAGDSSAPEADTSGPSVSHSEHPAAPTVTTETVIVPTSMPAPSYVKQGAGMPLSTTEIPQSMGFPEPATADIDRATDPQAIYYQARQNPQLIDPKLHSLQEFISEGDESSPLGVELREDQRKLNSGEIANGLTIVDVRSGSAAAQGGLRAARHTAHNVATGVAVAASLFFPPAVLAVPLLEQVNLGDSYDMIIGVDGARVVNFLDFEDRMRDVQPGQIVYLSIVRNGDRLQVPVHVQSLSNAPF
jgi:PDZ domain